MKTAQIGTSLLATVLRLNIEALREAAHARATVGPLKIHNLGRLSDTLVQAFHEIGGRAKADG